MLSRDGEFLGVTATTVSRWITNQAQPGIDTLFKIAKVRDVDVRELLVPTKEGKHL